MATSKTNIKLPSKVNLEEVQAPQQYQEQVRKLIMKNQDIFAAKDSELGHTNTVKMKKHRVLKTGDFSSALGAGICLDRRAAIYYVRNQIFYFSLYYSE